ncbi:MAG TPA: glucose 1-dehydrogenase [Rhizobacter sp.]|nr:glucose 1-dehydrogenase [Rhizobacter sp.]
MAGKLEGKVAIVTGASRGIGAAVARRLARDGASVAVVYKEQRSAADQVVGAIRAEGGRADALQADVSDDSQVRRMIRQALEPHGHIDVVVNAAGIAGAAPLGSIQREFFDHMFYVNAWSVVAVTQAALPHFPAAGGAIVNVSTSLVRRGRAGMSTYTASKAALNALTEGFARELGPRGIRVNAVAPAITLTDMTAGLPSDYKAQETEATPLRRLAEPEDIADAVAFLAGDDSRWITGRILLTDGGRN